MTKKKEAAALEESPAKASLAGGMTEEQRIVLEENTDARINHADDKNYRPQLLVPMGRAADADVSMLEDDSELPSAQRVGTRSVEHPRARMASAMHEWLDGSKPSAFSADELSAAAEKFGMQVDGTGADGAVVKTDFVRAMDALGAQFPASPRA